MVCWGRGGEGRGGEYLWCMMSSCVAYVYPHTPNLWHPYRVPGPNLLPAVNTWCPLEIMLGANGGVPGISSPLINIDWYKGCRGCPCLWVTNGHKCTYRGLCWLWSGWLGDKRGTHSLPTTRLFVSVASGHVGCVCHHVKQPQSIHTVTHTPPVHPHSDPHTTSPSTQ